MGGGWLDQMGIKLTQPQVELEAWAEFGKRKICKIVVYLSCSAGARNTLGPIIKLTMTMITAVAVFFYIS